MKVLVYDSYEEDFEAAEEVGIELEKIDDHSYVMNLLDDYKMYPEIVSRSSLPNKDDLAYSSGLGFSNLIEYINIGNKLKIMSILGSFIYACSDEIHQMFIGNRSGEVRDIIIDTFGALSGILIYYKIKKRSFFNFSSFERKTGLKPATPSLEG